MNVKLTGLDGSLLIELSAHRDKRGSFVERFKRSTFERLGLPTEFAQENHSRSEPGVLRGLHYQYAPQQGKLVGVTRGRIWDVIVDIRLESKTFGQSFEVELNDENDLMLWIPAGFAHGFCVLGDAAADVLYTCDSEYNADAEGGIIWCDADLNINWPVKDPIVSAKDSELQTFAEYREKPVTWNTGVYEK